MIITHHDGPLDQGGVIGHSLDQRVVVVGFVRQAKFFIDRLFFADQVYNRARQTQITSELLEVISGAEAVSN